MRKSRYSNKQISQIFPRGSYGLIIVIATRNGINGQNIDDVGNLKALLWPQHRFAIPDSSHIGKE
jgi:hypothetical protein